jgi:DNA-binding NtrC family response regulator
LSIIPGPGSLDPQKGPGRLMGCARQLDVAMDSPQRVKQSRPEIEVIILTGYESADTALVGMQGGAFDYLLKPCDLETLLERIHRAQEKKEIREK